MKDLPDSLIEATCEVLAEEGGHLVGGWVVTIQKWLFSAISASICGIPCAAYSSYASAQSLDFLDLAKKISFLDWR